VKRSTVGERSSVSHKEYVAHIRVTPDKLACVVLTDKDYPSRVGVQVATIAISKFVELCNTAPAKKWTDATTDELLFTDQIAELLKQSQTPEKVDDIEKIRKDITDTQEILQKTVSDLLTRGEKLDDLANQSEDLGMFSKEYLKKSESMNSCCLLL
jgi:synaptobrevin family protein YKT6